MSKFSRYLSEFRNTPMPEGNLRVLLEKTGMDIQSRLIEFHWRESGEFEVGGCFDYQYSKAAPQHLKEALWKAICSFEAIMKYVLEELDIVFNVKDEFQFFQMLDYVEEQGKFQQEKLDVLAWINS